MTKKVQVDNVPSEVSTFNNVNLKKLFVAFFILLLVAGVVLFSGSMREQENKVEVQPQVNSVEKKGISVDEFNEKVGRKLDEEASLIRKEKETTPDKQQEIKEKYAELLANKPASLTQLTETKKVDPFAEAKKNFELAEYERALNSQKSSVLLRGFEPTNTNNTSDTISDSRQNALDRINGRTAEAQNRLNNVGAQDFNLNTGSFNSDNSQFFNETNSFTSESSNSDNEQTITPAFPNGYAGSNASFFVNPPKGTKTVLAGTVIPLIFQSNSNSDNTSQVIARVRQDVYNINKTSIVIPAGSIVLSQLVRISSRNQAINHRNGIAGSTIIRPDGLKIDLTDLTMLDTDGTGNVKGRVNRHIIPRVLASVGYVLSTTASLDFLSDTFSDDNNNENINDEIVCTTTTTRTNNTNTIEGEEENTVTDTDENVTVTEVCQPRSTIVSGGNITLNSSDIDQNVQEVVVDRLAERFDDVFRSIFEPYFSLQNTIYTDAGQHANLVLTKDIYANEWENVYEKYIE